MKEIIRFDFGNSTVRADEGFFKIERLYKSCHFMWMTELKNKWRRDEDSSPYRDFVFGEKSEFRMALPAGEYLLRLHFYDPDERHAPFTVRACSVTPETAVFEGAPCSETEIDVPQGKKLAVDIPLYHREGQVAVDLIGREGGGFFIGGLDILSEGDVTFGKLFDEAPEEVLPTRAQVMAHGVFDPERALSMCCEWLMAHRTADGFLGDYEMNKRLWYTSSYPLRTLLAGYELFGREEYYDAAKAIFDRFIGEQLP